MLGVLMGHIFPIRKSLFERGYDWCAHQLTVVRSPDGVDNLWALCHSSQFDYGDFEKGIKQALYDAGFESTCPW